jgi:hypothetical protein
MEQMTESHFQFEEDRAAWEAKEAQVRPFHVASLCSELPSTLCDRRLSHFLLFLLNETGGPFI